MTTPVQPPNRSHNACEQAQDVIFNLQEAVSVSAEERKLLESHLPHCAACQAYQSDLSYLAQSIAALEQVEIPVGLADRIMARIGEAGEATAEPVGGASQRFLWKKYTPVAAAVLMVAIAVPLLMPNSPLSLSPSAELRLQADDSQSHSASVTAKQKAPEPQQSSSESIDGAQLAQGGAGLRIGLKQTYASETENDMYYDPVSTLVGF